MEIQYPLKSLNFMQYFTLAVKTQYFMHKFTQILFKQ